MIEIARTARGPIEYRSEGDGSALLVLNGGHTSCRNPVPHEEFLLRSHVRLVIPSRPGYGKTPSRVGRSAEESADSLIALLDCLAIERVCLLAVSAAGRTALQLAERHPDRVAKLILESAVTCEPWPKRGARVGTWLFFNRVLGGAVWACYRAFARIAPQRALTHMMRSLTTTEADRVVAHMSEDERRFARALFAGLRSGGGFLNDIRHAPGRLEEVRAPTLIIASMYDGAVAVRHAEAAAERIKNSKFLIVPAESHLVWLSPYREDIELTMARFLSEEPSRAD